MQSQRSETATSTSEPPAAQEPTTDSGSAAPEEEKGTKRKAPAAKKTEDEECSKKTKAPKRGSTSSQQTEDGKKKTQIRYDPDVPMSKEQLAAWRREARRVRNRESAAASRQRIRNRITELEDEVADWKSKYAEAMERLQTLEKASKTKPANGSNEGQL